MKWVILCLVLINVAFFGWQLRRDQTVVVTAEPVPPATRPAMVNRLLLVSELERGVLRQRRNLPSPLASPPEAQLPIEIAKADTDTTSISIEENLAVPPESDIECYTVGPLENEDDISAIGAWFSAQGSQAKLRSDERREVASTWLFLPPLESREAADTRARELQAANIDDIYVIPRGDMANAISLGLYSQNNTLHSRISQLEARGYTPSMLPRYRTVTASWFDVNTSAAQPITVAVLDQIFPDLIVRRVACGDAPIAGDPVISYNSSDLRREGSYPDNASGAALDAPGRSSAQ